MLRRLLGRPAGQRSPDSCPLSHYEEDEALKHGIDPARAVLSHPKTTSAAEGRDEGHFHPAPFQIVRSQLTK